MKNVIPDKESHTSIARRVRLATIALLNFIVIFIAVIANVVVRNIDSAASADRVHAYSIDAADIFHSYINDDLLLVRMASNSKAITDWFADEENEQKKIPAYNEIVNYANMLQNMHIDFGIADSLNEYGIDSGEELVNFVSRGTLSHTDSDDIWFFSCIMANNDYVLNIGYDKYNSEWRLWINHKVFTDGITTGAFCSGLQIEKIFQDMFGRYDAKTLRGYIINNRGIIEMDSTLPDKYQEGINTHVYTDIADPVFTEAIGRYIGRIDGMFTSSSQQEIIKLENNKNYKYASIAPVAGTDWSVVILYNSSLLSDISTYLPLFIILLAALFLYIVGQNTLMNRLIFTPLKRLTSEITEGIKDVNSFNGLNRSDEIGVLARTIQDTTMEVEHRDKILEAANHSAYLLLQAMDGDNFEATVLKTMEIIGNALNVDRAHFWQNELSGGEHFFVHKHQWLNNTGRHIVSFAADHRTAYKDRPNWEETFLRGGFINEKLSDLPAERQNFFNTYEIKSLMVVPLFVKGHFFGLFSIDDCHRERSFSNEEINIMRSVGLMIANSMLRDKMTKDIRDTAAKLEAVISNYSGVIWSVDNDHRITLLNGLYIKNLGVTPGRYEGWKLNEAQEKNKRLEIISNVQKTFYEGPQDWIIDDNDRRLHAHTTLIFDEKDKVSGIMGNMNDVTEMVKLQDQLEAALKKAQNADQAKSDFLAHMSHEMRTPLNAIIGLTSLALDGEELGFNVRFDIEKVYNAGTTLLSTVNDILDISKIEANKLELILVQYDTASLLNDTITQSIMHIGDKPIKFILDINENLPIHLFGDDLRTKQIFNNLLSNAFKYTREGSVTFGVTHVREGETVLLKVYVKDTGIGIKPENISAVFEDYGQVDTKANRMIMGTGLGMPITKRLVELMGGSIEVESEYGKGTTFKVTIPQKFVTDTIIGKEIVENLKTFHFSDHKREKNAGLKRIKLPYAKVLVIDDVLTNLDVSKGLMKPYGMTVDCMTSGQDAIDTIRAAKVKYNAVFMDHMMPGMDGIEATHLIRQIDTDYARTVPIIALTANAIVGNDNIFLQNGFQAFLSKPIEIEKLDAVIREWVRNEEQEKLYNEQHKDKNDDNPQVEGSAGPDLSGIHIEGIDIDKGINRYGGDKNAYLTIMRSFADNTPELLEKTKVVTSENLKDYTITVHGIKGASRGIDAEAVGNQAEALEKAGRAGDLDFIAANNPALFEAASHLIKNIKAALEQLDAHSTKERKDKPDNALLLRLKTACESYEMDEIDAVMAELEKYQYESGAELVDWLRSSVKLMNFKEIAEKISAMPETEQGE